MAHGRQQSSGKRANTTDARHRSDDALTLCDLEYHSPRPLQHTDCLTYGRCHRPQPRGFARRRAYCSCVASAARALPDRATTVCRLGEKTRVGEGTPGRSAFESKAKGAGNGLEMDRPRRVREWGAQIELQQFRIHRTCVTSRTCQRYISMRITKLSYLYLDNISSAAPRAFLIRRRQSHSWLVDSQMHSRQLPKTIVSDNGSLREFVNLLHALELPGQSPPKKCSGGWNFSQNIHDPTTRLS